MKVNDVSDACDMSSVNDIEENARFRMELERCQALVENRLDSFFKETAGYKTLLESMRYSLLGGGKRIRAVLCLKFCEAAGAKIEDALDSACALEMIHTYSLIHDDLPCMDNDDIRRGRPANHIKYDVFTATLAGDALQAAAFEVLLNSKLPAEILVELGRTIARAAGPYGICGGQYLDITAEGKKLTETEVFEIHNLKTAALFSAAAKMGVLAAGGLKEQLHAAEQYAIAVGRAFQIRDDVLDIISTQGELGKPIGSDKESKKHTFASLYGVEECNRLINNETKTAIKAISNEIFEDCEFLIWLARSLVNRSS